MSSRTKLPFDGLWLDDKTASWHIAVRCKSGFDGQLSLPKALVGDGDAVSAMLSALRNPRCHVVALVGAAGTGKSTAIGWLLRTIHPNRPAFRIEAIRCSSRSIGDIHQFLLDAVEDTHAEWIIIDGVDELRAEKAFSIDQLLQPIIPRILEGSCRILFSVRPDGNRALLVPPAEGLATTREWDNAWSGIETSARLTTAILRLQELRHREIEEYASLRGLGPPFVAHLRSLYDLRELVRRFFLLVRLCDLSQQLETQEWMQIRDRNALYEGLLTTWLKVERLREPQKWPLRDENLLTILELLALQANSWNTDDSSIAVRLGKAIARLQDVDLNGANPKTIADALINANVVADNGFAHQSIGEYLLARCLARLIRNGRTDPLELSSVNDEVISFLADNQGFRRWLDQNQDRLVEIHSEYLPFIVRLLHRQGRAIPPLNLQGANLAKLDLLGVRLRNADLRRADLEGTQLGPADLTNAKLNAAVLRSVSTWNTRGAIAVFSSADGPDRAWFLRPAELDQVEAVLVQIGFNEGRIILARRYAPRSNQVYSDGQSLYLLPRAQRSISHQATQLIGERISTEEWSLLPDSLPLASLSQPGAVWSVGNDQVALGDDDGIRQVHHHRNGSVRGALGVAHLSEFHRHQIDGFCLISSTLWSIGLGEHMELTNDLIQMRPLTEPIHRVVAVGNSRIFFRADTGWCSWTASGTVSRHPEFAEVTRVLSTPGGGFALIWPSKVEFVDETLQLIGTQDVTAEEHCVDMICIRREQGPALVKISRDREWLHIIDEHQIERAVWIQLRAQDARFDKTTVLSPELEQSLLRAGARNESAVPPAPLLQVSDLSDIPATLTSTDRTTAESHYNKIGPSQVTYPEEPAIIDSENTTALQTNDAGQKIMKAKYVVKNVSRQNRPDTIQKRLRDLADNIAQDHALLKQYEDELRLEDDPRRCARHQQEIDKLKTSASAFEREYKDLELQLSHEPVEACQSERSELQQIHVKLDALIVAQSEINLGLYNLRQAILARYDAGERHIINSITDRLDQTQAETVQAILDAVENNQFNEAEMVEAVSAIHQSLVEVSQHNTPLPKSTELEAAISAPHFDVKHKLKVSIPIIPLVLAYEGEVDLGSRMNLERVWNRIVEKFRRH